LKRKNCWNKEQIRFLASINQNKMEMKGEKGRRKYLILKKTEDY
jgi:hypothetical protein